MQRSLESWVGRVLGALSAHTEDLPALPSVAVRLIELIDRSEPSVQELASLIAQDQVVASRVLQAANSALYVGVVPIDTLPKALMRLGARETVQVAMAAAAHVLFDPKHRAELEMFPDVWPRFWSSCLVRAYGGRLIARELKRGDPERVFLGGMFCRVGSMIVVKVLSRGLVTGTVRERPTSDELAYAVDRLCVRLGVDYLTRSQMPAHVVDVTRRLEEIDPLEDTDELHVIRLADGLCHRLEVVPFATGALGELAEASAERLGLDAERLEFLELSLRELTDQVGEMM